MRQVDLILRNKEKRGLVFSILFRLVMLITLALAHTITHHSIQEVVSVVSISVIFICFSLFSLYMIRKENYLGLIGYSGILFDGFLMGFLLYTWYLSVGFYENVPSTYLLKTSLPTMAVVFIGINALAIRPAYPIIVAMIFNCIWAFVFYIVVQDPRTIYTDSMIENFFSPSIIPTFYLLFSITITAEGILFSIITYSYRKSLFEAVNYEVQNNQMGRYFSPGILEQIKQDDTIFLAKKSKVVVMFSDIRSFTSMSESMEAVEVVDFLRDYHSRMVEVIYSEGGTIDKFLGDGIMVTFGTPNPSPDDSLRAIRCAMKMQQALVLFNEARKIDNLHTIHQGIGIHYGDAVSGNIGSLERLEYTVIGDTVNVASRIESLCKEHNVDILFSEQFAQEIRNDYNVVNIANVQIRGKKDPITIYGLTK
ncbi:adenylate/guanylate cyclase domain-containing protein [Leptospira sp. GIMC2001]|uniref:adenylate/guanylate cyclase domain-containing protein n=1 Tax=Leptospira sp. GIMC2001 TaxID=1513297 RepID=UPI00234B4CCB|nr:adenylate/guanylate cyclase domain-containing protein [Leptospira sp. GIMC2001]WCL48688.1 adenylate/guanylate cyclase domain-containing protein [Leptospira sp. GIMC2001]